jgi:hypothetical protein
MKHDGYYAIYASIIYPQRKESHWPDTNEVVNSTTLISTVAEIVNRKISKGSTAANNLGCGYSSSRAI